MRAGSEEYLNEKSDDKKSLLTLASAWLIVVAGEGGITDETDDTAAALAAEAAVAAVAAAALGVVSPVVGSVSRFHRTSLPLTAPVVPLSLALTLLPLLPLSWWPLSSLLSQR